MLSGYQGDHVTRSVIDDLSQCIKKWLSPVIQPGFREDISSIRLLDIYIIDLSLHKKCLVPEIQPGFRAEIFYREHKALKDEVG